MQNWLGNSCKSWISIDLIYLKLNHEYNCNYWLASANRPISDETLANVTSLVW